MQDLDTILVESSRLMKQGIGLAEEAPHAALACFDRALGMRQRLPIDQVPVLRYDLAACWLNRAQVLVGIDRAGEALQAYDEALALLRSLPLDEDPRFARRLAIACQNRGRLLADARESIAAFMNAIEVLERHGAGVADRQQLLATVWMNAATAWMTDETGETGETSETGDTDKPAQAAIQAARAARLAVALVEGLEQQDPAAAEVGVNARHVLCRVLATTSLAITRPTSIASDDIHDATDLADDALTLIEHWERQGVTPFRAIAADFLRFGAHVYASHQPAFLQEFLQEHLDPARSSHEYIDSPELRQAATDTAPKTYYVKLAVHID